MLEVEELLLGQDAVRVAVEMTEHPARLHLARVESLQRLELALALGVAHDDGEPVEQAVAYGDKLLFAALNNRLCVGRKMFEREIGFAEVSDATHLAEPCWVG